MCSVTSPYACAGARERKEKTPYGGSTRVLGEPAAVLYRLGSIINHWNSSNKKSRGFFRCHYYHRARCRKEKTIVCDCDCGSVLRKRFDEAMQKHSRGFRTHSRTNSSDWRVWGGCWAVGLPLQSATSAGARSIRLPSASARDTSRRRRRRRAPQTLGERPRSPFHLARRVERTRRTARRPGSSSLRTTRSCCHCPPRSGV